MKGPSLDAIRKFKEQQERKKREEDERKIKEKLSTLEHRANQGDRKAKSELKKIEKIKEERQKAPELQSHVTTQKTQAPQKGGNIQPASSKGGRRPPPVETDFEELMKLAKNNTNEIKRTEEPKPEVIKAKKKEVSKLNGAVKVKVTQPEVQHKQVSVRPDRQLQLPSKQSKQLDRRLDLDRRIETHKQREASRGGYEIQYRPSSSSVQASSGYPRRPPVPMRPPPPHMLRRGRYDDEDDEDDYESDGFVVDDEEEDAREELSKTIRSVFRYDKRRCDLREEELDRQYRAIGRVSTFEDLEREERRASRLAAAEDAEAFREEEERKKMKKLRLQKP